MENIQKIKANLSKIPCPFGTRPHADRIETGALQINDDWPGVFLRGDYSFACVIYLNQAISILEKMEDSKNMDIFLIPTLKDLEDLLMSCRV
jgi:hypothetical protein